jgi:hypothetical protein
MCLHDPLNNNLISDGSIKVNSMGQYEFGEKVHV